MLSLKYQLDWRENKDFLSIVNSWASSVFFAPVSNVLKVRRVSQFFGNFERLRDRKLRCYLGQLKIEIAKAEKMHGPGTLNVSFFI